RVAEQPDWSDLATLVRTGETSSPTSSGTTSPVSRLKWLGQRVFGQINVHVPLPAAPSSGADRTRVILPAPHGSFGDEAMGIVAARKYPDADLVVPGDPAPWRSLVPDPVGVLALGDLTVGPGMTPTRRTVDALADGPVVVIGADTLAGDYELSLLATRVRLLNAAVAAGHPASLVNFSLPETVHPDARRILRRLDAGVTVRARDAVSARRAHDVFGREVSCAPDIAAELEPAGEVGEGSPVVFVPNAHLGGMYGVTTEQLVDLWRNTGVQLGQPVEVVVHDIREEVGDLELGRRIAAALEEAGIPASVTVPATAAEAKGAISGAQVCISARMHACVAALSSGVPTVGIGYVGKFSGQFAWYGDLGAVVEYRPDLTAEEIVDLVAQEDRAA
ncbi:polysaccharide pyruvyl transferase family protein, partial [Corynebacterium variabile]|uniref:polysaccharide pyruvyl transferase family protein n=1 Tax=Corynebacterium variabile TaxID=1727 RepID=UPI0028E89FF7